MKGLKINPVVLILINILAPSMYIFINGKYLMIYLLVFSSLLMILMGRVKRMIALLIIFFSMYGAHLLTMKTGVFESFGLFLIVLAQSVPVIALATVLVSKYSSAQLLSALETMRLPRALVVAVTITIKYIPTFKREFGYIKESMRLRGISFTWKRPIKSFQYFVVPQLFRCAALAEEVTAAGLVKGIDAPERRSSFFEQKVRWYDLLVLILFIAGLAGIYILKEN
ncbi:MAG: energy-coupling factor transporter transmembrane protein EcfT [Eubacterium sp.]|nr:energy-coupling factor transporter transmembrane protein EcfT [Eubacterium sp.]